MGDYRRMNVAVTRAKLFIGIVADYDTISGNEFLKTMLDYFRDNGEVRMSVQFIG